MAIGQQTSAPEGSATEQAQQKAQEVKQQAQQQARQVAGQARDRIRGQVDDRSTQAGHQLSGQAEDIRTVAQQLREQGKDKPAQLVDQAAQQTDRVASYLRDSDADRMLNDAEDFARRNPWAVVAGGIALGFAVSRFLKASGSERYERWDAQRRYNVPPPPPPLPPAADVPVPVSPGEGYAPTIPGADVPPGRRPGTEW